ncbi:MAG TPA: PilZ domain-containing protein [Croceibacterium sp.]|nr:PilZ domain-containing protein [Croceibacterium sp.]
MSNVDTRQVNRDSLFLLAQVRVDGQDGAFRVKVRNLSAGGMMAEGEARVMRGALVQVELRNIGWVHGSVAWTQDNRFGIAFVNEIDPVVVRAPAASSAMADFDAPRYTRNHSGVPIGQQADLSNLRKI